MKTHLLPEGNAYKADLHSHSCISDGRNTPEEMKAHYKSKGYRILALTDHEFLVDHSDLNDPDFLMLTGYEFAFCESGEAAWRSGDVYLHDRTLELNLFARDPHNVKQVCFDPRYIVHGQRWRIDTAERVESPYERVYTIPCIQHLIDTARAYGFIVSVNHPAYSMETPAFFGQLEGIFAMEIINQGSYYQGDYNPGMYDEVLRMGRRWGCIATDDSHRADVRDGDEADPRPWGFTMIHAASLAYADVIRALENGDYYASNGPRIEALYIEDGVVKLDCSAAKFVSMRTRFRHNRTEAADLHETLTHAEFPLPAEEPYMRFEVIDAYGRRAFTRAYFRGTDWGEAGN